MKKRRELDALVNGKQSRRKKGQHHELLRNDSDSSEEVEEFSVSDKNIARKRGSSSRLCATCLIVLGFVVLLACVIAISGLVFVYFNVDTDVRLLRSQLDKVIADSKSSPGEFQGIHKQQVDLQKAITDIQTGTGGLVHIRQNITVISKQLSTLTTTTQALSDSLNAAPQLKALPKTVNDLKQEIADVGSKLASVQHSLEDMQSNKKALSDKVDAMTQRLNGMVRVVSGQTEKPDTLNTANEGSPEMLQEIQGLRDALTKTNVSTWQQFQVVTARGQQHESQIAALRNTTRAFESRLSLVELSGTTRPVYNMSSVMTEAVDSVKEELLNLSQSAGESAITALRADIMALNSSLRDSHINTKTDITPDSITNLYSRINTTSVKLQKLERSLESAVANITAVNVRVKSQEDRLSAVEKSDPIDAEVDYKAENDPDKEDSDGVIDTGVTGDNTDQSTELDKLLGEVTEPLVVAGDAKSTNPQEIPVEEGSSRDKPESETRHDDLPVTQQPPTSSQATPVTSKEDSPVDVNT